MLKDKRKPLPIGISDFKLLREEGYYYVDKTLLIQEIKESGQVVLVTRPRRFGKTLNLSMLRYFFSISEESCAPLFFDTAIWQLPAYKALQGTFPVIFISLRELVQPTYDSMIAKFGYVIAREFERHKVVLSGDTLEPHEKERFIRIRTEKAMSVDLGSSLEFLLRMLHKFYRKKVIVLIDEYDVPIQTAFLNNFYYEAIAFLKELMTGFLKDQAIIEKGVVTGNLVLAQAGIFTGLNNLDIHNVTRRSMADKFGFTKEETGELLSTFNYEAKEGDIQKWYNGYTFGETAGIFNPWSVLKCICNDAKLENYWANTSDNILLKMLIGKASQSIKADLELLLRNQSVSQAIEESIVFPDLTTLPSLVWSLLLHTGYVTYTHSELHGNTREWSLVIPNNEIKIMLAKLISDIFTRKEILEKASGKALDQIRHKKYIQELMAREFDTIIAYGIAFEGKKVKILSERFAKD